MAYCTKCGSQMADVARFCPNCGQPAGAAPLPGYSPSITSAEPLSYTLEGNNLQIARIHMRAGQEMYAEAGKMVYKTPAVQWETRMQGETLGQKLWGAVKRKLMGESLFLTYFHAMTDGEVGFAGTYPGKIQVFNLAPGQSKLVQRDSFLAAQTTVQLNLALVRKLGVGFFGGEGFILEKLTGPGQVFIHGGGDFLEFELKAGEMLQVDTGCIVAFDESVTYDIQMVGSIKTAIFGGEGLFLATLTGPGHCVIQSMTLAKMRRELAPAANTRGNSGGDSHIGLDAITSIFSNDD